MREMRPEQKEVVLRVSERLLAASIGETVSYQAIHAAAGPADVSGWVIRRARDLLIETHGVVFSTVRKEGLRRLGSADGTNYSGEKALLRVRRAARAGGRRLMYAARYANDLSPEEQRQANARQCALGLIEHLSMSRTVNTLPTDVPLQKIDGLAPLRAALGL